MKLDLKQSKALLYLAVYYILHLLKMPFRNLKKTDNYNDFLKKYSSDNIFPISSDERKIFAMYEKCINCGLCQSNCPILETPYLEQFIGPLSIASSFSRSLPDVNTLNKLVYYCTQCGRCESICPQNIPIVDIVCFLRRKIYEQNPEMPSYRDVIKNLELFGNIYGGILPSLAEFEKAQAEYVLFTGCVYSFRENKSLQSIMSLLKYLKIDFTIFEEKCCGEFLNSLGLKPLVELEQFEKHNIQKIKDKKAKGIITICPQCYLSLLQNPVYNKEFKIQYILDLIPLSFSLGESDVSTSVAFHNPCLLSIHNNKTLLRAHQLVEKHFSSYTELNSCCGAGGGVGRIERQCSLSIAGEQLNKLLNHDISLLLTECPSCVHNFRRTKLKEQPIQIFTLTEYLGQKLGL